MAVPSPTSRSGSRIYVSFWDLLWALVTPIMALYLRDIDPFHADWGVVGYYWVLSTVFALLAFSAFRIQDGMTRYFSVREALNIAEAVLFAQLTTCAVTFAVTRLDGIPRMVLLVHGLLLATGLIAARMFVRIVSSDEPLDHDSRQERIILIGANPFASAFIHLLNAYAPQRQPVIAVLDENAAMIGRAISGIQVLGTPHELGAIISEFAIHGIRTDRIVIAGEVNLLSPAVLNEIEHICKERQIDLSFLPRMIGVTEQRPSNVAASSEPVLSSERMQEESSFAPSSFFRLKRWIDMVGSLALIVLFFPVLVLASVLVFLDVGRPILFWQERLGWKRRSFLVYKFRTLNAPFDSAGNATLEGRRPSAIGRFLRTTRIDELPQLLNVLLGEMSLIGPRPLLPEDQPLDASVRLSVRPGISGWAQVNGGKLVTKEDKEKLDEWYVRNASLWVDLRIMMMTINVMLRGRVSSEEMSADTDQVQSKNISFERSVSRNA